MHYMYIAGRKTQAAAERPMPGGLRCPVGRMLWRGQTFGDYSSTNDLRKLQLTNHVKVPRKEGIGRQNVLTANGLIQQHQTFNRMRNIPTLRQHLIFVEHYFQRSRNISVLQKHCHLLYDGRTGIQ